MSDQKKGNREGDLVLIYHEDKPAIYGRIEAIEPDIKRDWYQVTLLLLSVPPQTVTWILRREYIDGGGFTMGGRPMRLERVEAASKAGKAEAENPAPPKNAKPVRVIPFKKKP